MTDERFSVVRVARIESNKPIIYDAEVVSIDVRKVEVLVSNLDTATGEPYVTAFVLGPREGAPFAIERRALLRGTPPGWARPHIQAALAAHGRAGNATPADGKCECPALGFGTPPHDRGFLCQLQDEQA